MRYDNVVMGCGNVMMGEVNLLSQIYYYFFSMKNEKVFVRYNNFDDGPPPRNSRNERRPYEKKKYAEKQNRNREAFKMIYDSYEPLQNMPPTVSQLLQKYPKFFNIFQVAPSISC